MGTLRKKTIKIWTTDPNFYFDLAFSFQNNLYEK